MITQQFSNAPRPAAAGSDPGERQTGAADTSKPFGDDGFSFADFIDIINPLQHIPVLGSIYRRLSGDTIDPAARVAGGALFGGPIGAALAIAGTAVESALKGRQDTVASVTASATASSAGDSRETRADSGPLLASLPRQQAAAAASTTVSDAGKNQANPVIRGGWIINAAYAGKSSQLFQWARDPGSEYAEQIQANARVADQKVSVNI